jgi:hypothetical protein
MHTTNYVVPILADHGTVRVRTLGAGSGSHEFACRPTAIDSAPTEPTAGEEGGSSSCADDGVL